MRKKLLIILLILYVFASVGIGFSKKTEVQADSANGYRVEQVFADKFNKEELDSAWTLNGASMELNYCGIHCKSPVSYGYGTVLNAATLSEKTQINFTIYPLSGVSSSNITFIIGTPSPSAPLKEPDVDCKVMLWNNQIVFCDWKHNLEVNTDKIDQHVLRGFNGLYSDLERTDVSINIIRTSNVLTKIYVEYSRDGEVIYSTKGQEFELENPRYFDKYCGFFWDVVEMDITNFEIYNDEKLVWEDKLTTNTLTYDATDYRLGNIHVNGILNESNVYVSRVSTVKMDEANESIVNSNELVKIDNVQNPYTLDYSLKFNSLTTSSFAGFGFGMSETDTRVDAKNAIGFIKKDAQTAEVVAIKNGVVDRSNSYQISLSKLGNGKYVNCQIVLDASNNAYLTIGGSTFKFSNISIYGRTGIGVVELGSGESSSFELKEFSLSKNVCNMYATEDASNDLKGTYVPDPDDPLYVEPYLNDQKYYLGAHVTVEKDWTTGVTAIQYSSATPYSGFGYTKPYSEWILEFDVEFYNNGQGKMFGVSFGRTSYVDVLMEASTSSSAYILRDDSGVATQVTYGSGVTFENGSSSQTADINVFSKNQTKYHMLFVAMNRTVYVYFKAQDAPASELGILRAKITNVNIDGYVSIVGNNNASFGITNYKIVNLSDANTTESELTLRESFNDAANISGKISLGEGSQVANNELVLNASNVKTSSKKLFEILRFTTQEIKDKLEIKFSTDKSIVIDSKANKITIKEGTVSTDYDCSAINLSYVKGKRFEIAILNDQIKISYKGFYDPADKLHETFITHKLTSELTEDYITIESSDKSVIDDLYLFSLDNSESCLTYNFEDDPNTAEVWSVKPDYDPSKVYGANGCKSSIGAITLIVAIAGLVPVLVLRKKEEE